MPLFCGCLERCPLPFVSYDIFTAHITHEKGQDMNQKNYSYAHLEYKEIDIPEFMLRRVSRNTYSAEGGLSASARQQRIRQRAKQSAGRAASLRGQNVLRLWQESASQTRQRNRRPNHKNYRNQRIRGRSRRTSWWEMALVVCIGMLFIVCLINICIFLFSSVTDTSSQGDESTSDDRPVLLRNKNRTIVLPEWVVSDILPLNEYSRPGTKLDGVRGVVVHYTGNPGTTAEQNRSYYGYLADNHERKVSSHFVIGMDGKVIQCVPLDEVAYCSNNRNHDTISIECCHPDKEGEFSKATMDSLIRLLDWLAETYDLEREQIIRHYDVTGKLCPQYYVKHEDKWEHLLDRITFAHPE